MKTKLKKLKKALKKLNKSIKAIIAFMKQIKKNYISMKNKMKKIWAATFVTLCVTLTSCGTTHVSVNRPDNGTYTQITVTTNNPITTTTDADASAEIK